MCEDRGLAGPELEGFGDRHLGGEEEEGGVMWDQIRFICGFKWAERTTCGGSRSSLSSTLLRPTATLALGVRTSISLPDFSSNKTIIFGYHK